MDYATISKETVGHLYQSHASLATSPLAIELRALVELRVSQINRCRYCCSVHTAEAKKAGISVEKLEALSDWQQSDLFTDKEQAALQWATDVTGLSADMPQQREQLAKHFSEREIVDLTVCISLMNALNRIAIHLREP